MSKIMCDVCGTQIPKNASCCPICGWAPEAMDAEAEGVTFDNQPGAVGPDGTPHGSRQLSSVFGHKWEENEDPNRPMGYPDHSELRQQFNSPLVIALVIAIILLLVATSVLFFGFFLPNRNKAVAAVETTAVESSSQETETTAPSVPCTGLVLTSGKAELVEAGQFFLIHVKAMPENTTDAIQFISDNPEVATVSESGRITAVAEGDTSIMIICGSQMIRTNVSVHFTPEETTTAATTETAAPSEQAQAETEQTEATEETTAETTEETTEAATEATTEETKKETQPLKDVALKLAKRDVKLECKRGQYTTLRLDCDLEPEEVEWFTSDANIAKVEDGKVYAMGNGTANITVRYGDQETICIVRCKIIA